MSKVLRSAMMKPLSHTPRVELTQSFLHAKCVPLRHTLNSVHLNISRAWHRTILGLHTPSKPTLPSSPRDAWPYLDEIDYDLLVNLGVCNH